MERIKIEFPAGDTKAAQLFGAALLQYGGGLAVPVSGAVEVASAGDDTPAPSPSAETGRAAGDSDASTDGQPARTPPPPGDAEQVDTNGVAFDGDYCGKANEPFYNSGPRAGQWKKRRGLPDEEYDTWYASQLASSETETEAPPADTAAAFAPPDAAETPPPPPASNSAYGAYCEGNAKPPGEFGSLMLWISELQAAGRVADDIMNEAREVAGVQMTDLFPPSTPEAVAKCIDKLAVYIESKAGQ